jgi:hypothetical protein
VFETNIVVIIHEQIPQQNESPSPLIVVNLILFLVLSEAVLARFSLPRDDIHSTRSHLFFF